jgi:hypothetical protein
MDTIPTPQPSDLARQLPADVNYRIVHDLRGHLPPPEIDTPEGIARRDNAAIARVAALLPVTAAEAELARQAVSAGIYAADCLRLAILHPRRAAEIRRLGGLPSPCTYGPPEEPLLSHLVHGRTATLLALDAEFGITPPSHPARADPAQHNTETNARPALPQLETDQDIIPAAA